MVTVAEAKTIEERKRDFEGQRSTSLTLKPAVLEQVVKTLEEFSTTVTDTDDPAVAYFHQGIFLCRKNQIGPALASFHKALESRRDFAEAFASIGYLYASIALLFKDVVFTQWAADFYRWALELRPNYSEVYLHLGNLCQSLGHTEAADCWRRAIDNNPELPEAHLKLSIDLIRREKKIAEGLEHFEKALALKPDWIEAYAITHFDDLYLEGQLEPQIAEYYENGRQYKKIRARANGIDRLNLGFLPGIAPAIGHYCYLDDIVKLRALEMFSDPQPVILVPPTEIVNPCLLGYWSKYIPVLSSELALKSLSPIAPFLEFDSQVIKGFRENFDNDWFKASNYAQLRWEEEKRPPLLQLSSADCERGWSCLRELGVPEGSWFVAVHVRDDGFKGPDSSHSLRNADINSFKLAFESITSRGGWVVRMGDAKMVPCPSMPGVIDYARSDKKSDWMDVFLWSQCRFFLGGNSGPSWLPHTFGVPTVRVNWTPITRVPWCAKDLLIPKLCLDEKSNRLLTFREMIDPAGAVEWTHSSTAIRSRGILPIDNTPEEIDSVVREMLSRFDRTIGYSAAENARQQQLDSCIREICAGHDRGDRTSRIGREFLAHYSYLID